MSYFSLRANFAIKICLNKKKKNNEKRNKTWVRRFGVDINCTVQFETGGVSTPEIIEVRMQHVLALID